MSQFFSVTILKLKREKHQKKKLPPNSVSNQHFLRMTYEGCSLKIPDSGFLVFFFNLKQTKKISTKPSMQTFLPLREKHLHDFFFISWDSVFWNGSPFMNHVRNFKYKKYILIEHIEQWKSQSKMNFGHKSLFSLFVGWAQHISSFPLLTKKHL